MIPICRASTRSSARPIGGYGRVDWYRQRHRASWGSEVGVAEDPSLPIYYDDVDVGRVGAGEQVLF